MTRDDELRRALEKMETRFGVDVDPIKDPEAVREEFRAVLEDLSPARRKQAINALARLDDVEEASAHGEETSPAKNQYLDALTGGPSNHPAHEEDA